MSAASAALILIGLVALVAGGEVLVRGAGGLARSFGMSPLLVGLTVVAFATSAPELAVALDATLAGSPGLAVGNVVGSNIANVLLVLGLSAVVLAIAVESLVLRRDIPAVALVSILTLLLSLDLRISRMDGLLLLATLAVYLVHTVVAARRDPPVATGGQAARGGVGQAEPTVGGDGRPTPALADQGRPTPAPAAQTHPATAPADLTHPAPALAAHAPAATSAEPASAPRNRLVQAAQVAAGVAMLVVGAGWLVDGSTEVARSLGVSDLVIGLTVVAVGTSLPELATSLIAALRGQRDMAVGNIVGSCLFNLGAVLGVSAIVASGGVPIEPSAVRFDLPFMVATAIVLLPMAFTGLVITRWEGLVLVGYYVAYLVYLVLTATEHTALPAFSAAMRLFVIPLTVFVLGLTALHEVRRRRGSGHRGP